MTCTLAWSCSRPACRRCSTGWTWKCPPSVVKGHLFVTEPTELRLPGTVAPVATQFEDGRLLVGGTFDAGDESPQVRPEVIEAILEGLYTTMPELRGLRAAHQWCCFPPSPSRRTPSSTGSRASTTPGSPLGTTYRHPAGAGDGPGHRQLDRDGRAAGRGGHVGRRQVRRPPVQRPLSPGDLPWPVRAAARPRVAEPPRCILPAPSAYYSSSAPQFICTISSAPQSICTTESICTTVHLHPGS